MAQMYQMRKGKLDEILLEKRMNRKSIQRMPNSENKVQMLDKKTIIKLNQGKSVSIGSFKKLSELLVMPLEDLIEKNDETDWEFSNLDLHDVELDHHVNFDNVFDPENPTHGFYPKEKLRSDWELTQQVVKADKIRIKLELEKVSDIQKDYLEVFERILAEERREKENRNKGEHVMGYGMKNANDPNDPFAPENLLGQINSIRQRSELSECISAMEDEGLFVYAKLYKFWQRKPVKVGEETVGVDYLDTDILAIAVVPKEKDNYRFEIFTGLEFPLTASEIGKNKDYFFDGMPAIYYKEKCFERSNFKSE